MARNQRTAGKRPQTSSNSTPAKRQRANDPQSSSSNRPKRQVSKPSLKSTPTKSGYFSQASDSGIPSDDTSEDDEQSGYEDEDASAVSASSSEAEESDFSSDDGKVKRRGARKPSSARATPKGNTLASSKDLWKEGVKSGLGPGTQVIIKKPKARPAGKTPYTDDALHPNTLLFLADLKANNNRQWLKCKRSRSRRS